ncbi:potassium channel, subfamily K, member 13-like [Tachypleus tridentatus]|uniref:potassium channel, subfamily K, member 13-like n=1 Tax=Tachypleus tridentatus TaxID=6853 RepID=UPI003FCFA95E
MAQRRRGCCRFLHLGEDNARFLLLAVIMVIYMLFGATAFHWLESDHKKLSRQRYERSVEQFWIKYNNTVSVSDVEHLLYSFGNASAAGLLHKRRQWDLSGAFYFVGTVVSTIGFGMTTPQTVPGKIMVILYGFLGCSGVFLFFNLFLERSITFLTFVLRSIHEIDLRRKGQYSKQRCDSPASLDDQLNIWKPSVYWVILYLFLTSILLAVCASTLYAPMEEWSYFEAIYFCFVAFATIGFGDYVTSQRATYQNVELYRLVNFLFLVCGSCIMYSFFNVTTIVIKQFLSHIIKKLDCNCKCKKKAKGKSQQNVQCGRRDAITLHQMRHYKKSASVPECSDLDSTYDSEGDRRNSDELISMEDFMKSNKVSLAVMQKQLHESAIRRQEVLLAYLCASDNEDEIKPETVGPLTIASRKLKGDIT